MSCGIFRYFLHLCALGLASANTFHHIYENIQTEPKEFIFNSIVIVLLLGIGGILAGNV